MAREVIYLDYAATSPVDPRVADAMASCLTRDGVFANPASAHVAGRAARRIVDRAREHIGALVNASPRQLVFTSGATEANNLALKGMLAAGGQLVTTRIEHRSVLDPAEWLAARGVGVRLLDCDRDGLVAPGQVAAAIGPDTRLVSVMHVNNEIGSVQDIAGIARVCRDAGVPLHVDAAQAAGKVPLDIEGLGIDLCSLTAHKLNGPKGIGALFVRPGLRLEPLISGGEAELGVRAGTLPTHQIAGFGKAFELATGASEMSHLAAQRERLWERVKVISGARRNGSRERSAPHILNVSFPGVEGESLRLALEDLAVSAGSACTSRSAEPSHVLRSLGLSDVLAESSLRFSVGRFTTDEEIDRAAERVRAEVESLRRVSEGSPDWCSS